MPLLLFEAVPWSALFLFPSVVDTPCFQRVFRFAHVVDKGDQQNPDAESNNIKI